MTYPKQLTTKKATATVSSYARSEGCKYKIKPDGSVFILRHIVGRVEDYSEWVTLGTSVHDAADRIRRG